ncbi:MAG: thiosulfate oxidation carrier complex protein SoxZ [Gammaproteobacteria bacterium]|nr:thiosulfate oxidation carrier complex protein SoxZ [Gammaproteobacteria bacterium]
MAKNSIKIKAKNKGGKTEVKALIKHNMETGLRKDKKTGEKIPAHYIKEVVCKHNGSTVFTANWGIAVSKNPYLSFKFTGGNKGDTIDVSWVDNKGDTDSRSTKV